MQFILNVIEESNAKLASLAVKSLAAYRHDPKIRERVMQIAREREDLLVTEAAKEVFA